ncbi:MAG TPA: VWA domain-containing protein [Opitutaceae bacterium]|nr:VWA domain-containing protein [Opitutaceae bacterium]
MFRRLAGLVALAVFGLRLPAEPAPCLIVFDASGSMHERLGGETKIDIAKRAVSELVATLPAETRLGLVVYGHRKPQDCEDIELLLPPAKLDRQAFIGAVKAIKPKGRTPLAGALEVAAAKLEYTTRPASIILVTDGLETCGQDPCAVAARLKAAGVSFVVHAVAFDLSSREAKSIACIAHATGGRFLQAKDAASLKDALAVVAAEAVAAPAAPKPPEPAPKPVVAPIPVTLKAPEKVDVGATFTVAWTGPDASGDFITVVPKGTADDDDGNLTYTRRGSPLMMTAPVDPGEVEVRYVSGSDHAVRARAAVKVLGVDVTLEAPPEAIAGTEVKVVWTGPGNDGDALAIVPQGAAEDFEAEFCPVEKGKPALVTAPMQPGAAEIRYLSGQRGRVLGRRPITIAAAKIELSAPDEVVAGSTVVVSWMGPNGRNDYVTIVPKNAPDTARAGFGFTGGVTKFPITTPIDAGECEIRYVSGQDGSVLARRALRTVAGEATLVAENQAMAGGSVSVAWKGPNNENDFITVVPTGSDERGEPAYTAGGSPSVVRLPVAPGAAEIRYVAGADGRILARRPLDVVEPRAWVLVPASAPAGATVSARWSGPDGENDFLTIVPAGSPDDTVGVRAWTMGGSPLEIETPAEPGAYEIRYVVFRDGRVLERAPITIGVAGSAVVERAMDAPAVSGHATGAAVAAVVAGAKPAEPPVIGNGERVEIAQHLVRGRITVFVVTNLTGSFGAQFHDECRQVHAQRDDVAVVFVEINRPGIKWMDGDSPAAAQFDVKTHGIPRVILYDAAGQPMPEEMNEQATIWRWLHVRGH